MTRRLRREAAPHWVHEERGEGERGGGDTHCTDNLILSLPLKQDTCLHDLISHLLKWDVVTVIVLKSS